MAGMLPDMIDDSSQRSLIRAGVIIEPDDFGGTHFHRPPHSLDDGAGPIEMAVAVDDFNMRVLTAHGGSRAIGGAVIDDDDPPCGITRTPRQPVQTGQRDPLPVVNRNDDAREL